MLWKELRENLKWAALAVVVLALAEFYALSTARDGSDNFNNITLCGSTFLLVTSFGCALVGAAIGTLQILPELRRDQWASLLHRPVTRSTIFFGKVAAGLILCFSATTLPFLASVAYVAMPGQFAAPLVPGLLLPGLSDLFLGMVFYFLALLLCLHRGRWMGSRGAIILSVLPVFVLHLTAGWPFLLPIGASLVLLLAAWGAMLANGSMRDRPPIARIACVAVIFTGGYAALLLLGALIQLLPHRAKLSSATNTDFRIAKDGQVFLSTQKGDGSDMTLTDMDGKPVTDERYVGNNSGMEFCQTLPLAWHLKKDLDLQNTFLRQMPRLTMNYVRIVERNFECKEAWYFLVARNYFVGYDKLSRRCVGICDKEGFRSVGAAAAPFTEKMTTSVWGFPRNQLYWSGTQMYSVDFSERSIKPVFHVKDDVICGALNVASAWDKEGFIAAALEKEVRIFDSLGKPLFSIPYRYDTAIWGQISIATNAAMNRIYLQYGPNFEWGHSDPSVMKQPVFLDVIDLQGVVLNSYSHPSDRFSATPPDWLHQFFIRTSPPVPALVGTISRQVFPQKIPEFVSSAYPRPSWVVAFEELPIIFGVSLMLAILAWFQATRAGFSVKQTWRWSLFVFCMGLPAFITFRLAADWPTRVPCPQCGRKRPVESRHCPVCHNTWPPPQLNGSEIVDF